MAVRSNLTELDLEEQLFAGAVCGPLQEFEGLLENVGDVDFKNSSRRTLLHVVVRLGRLEWVERLLEVGADPGVVDGNGATALEVAREMLEKTPESADRGTVLRLVRLAHATACRRRRSGSDVASGGGGRTTDRRGDPETQEVLRLSRRMASSQEQVVGKLTQLTSKLDLLSQNVSRLCMELSCVKGIVVALAGDVSFLKESSPLADTERTSISRALRSVADQVRVGASLREAVDGVKGAIASRDALLGAQETSVTSLAQDLGERIKVHGNGAEEEEESSGQDSSKPDGVGACVEESLNKAVVHNATDVKVSKVQVYERIHSFSSGNGNDSEEEDESSSQDFSRELDDYEACIDELLGKTVLYNATDVEVSKVRQYYERIYSVSPLTRSILTFLQFQSRVKISIDFESNSISRMKPLLKNCDGELCEGANYRAYACLDEKVVYLGGKIEGNYREEYLVGYLAAVLARMAMHLAFRNGGRPYARGDSLGEAVYRCALNEAIGYKDWVGSRNCEFHIRVSLNCKTKRGREVTLISAVPGMLAVFGSMDVMLKLREHLPSLLDYYQGHVMPTLARETEERMG